MTQPQRPDQIIDPPAAVLAPGGAAGIFRGRLVIIIGGSTTGASGLFMYNPALALDDLVESGSPVAGTDSAGNAYLAGWTSYGLSSGSTYLAASLQEGSVQFWVSTTGEAGPYTENVAIGVAGSTFQYFTATETFIGQGTPAVAAPDPGISSPLTKESWHNLSLVNGWAGGLRYRLLPDGRVEIAAGLDSSAATAFQCGTMPANYIPTSTEYVAAGATANVASGVAPFIQIVASTGVVNVSGLHAFSNAGTFVAGGSYAMD